MTTRQSPTPLNIDALTQTVILFKSSLQFAVTTECRTAVVSGGFRGAEPAPPPPVGRRTDAVTVLLISDNGTGTVLWRVLNFDRSTVKHAVQNTRNDCHQWLSDSSAVHQIRFRPGLHPGPRWRSLQHSPNPRAGLRGPASKGKRRRGERRTGKMERRRGKTGDERRGGAGPFTRILGSAPGCSRVQRATKTRQR